jgi:hypothetical protein
MLIVLLETRLHVIIYDADEEVYQVPDSVLPRPQSAKPFDGLLHSGAWGEQSLVLDRPPHRHRRL